LEQPPEISKTATLKRDQPCQTQDKLKGPTTLLGKETQGGGVSKNDSQNRPKVYANVPLLQKKDKRAEPNVPASTIDSINSESKKEIGGEEKSPEAWRKQGFSDQRTKKKCWRRKTCQKKTST